MAAIDDLNGLLFPLPGYPILTDAMKQRALATALIPDGAGVWPAQPGYQNTYDVYWAAMSLVGYLQSQPFVKSSSSEGTAVAVEKPDWGGILSFFRSQSVIAAASQSGPILNPIPIPDSSHVIRTDMSGGDSYGDVDTDLG
ncbi:hypothetical protein SEA_LUNA18_10 [Microbacterium phage Luna18]|nr:hypothetical protein SEA_KATCHAN_10 [Microbacterium phage KatChan]URQ04861.1 hypothetical protein SEA_LUNA18_10 [Microbacterium phage Luna18]